MKLRVSKKIFAHIDCDSFFASCEILRNPSLKGKYVCVGSEIIVAASYNAKNMGVKCGTPIWEAQKILKDKKAYFFGVDIPYYQKISRELMSFLEEHTLDVRKFSIDEAFVEITGLPEMQGKTLETYIISLQKNILETIGIPVSIGVSNTRLRAKIFSKIRKPFGYYIGLDTVQVHNVFRDMSFREIPFIGKQTAKKLDFYITSIYDYMALGYHELVRRFGKNGGKIWIELSGVEAMCFESRNFAKSIGRSRAFNREMTSDKQALLQKIFFNLHRIESELQQKNMQIRHLRLVLIDKDWKKYSAQYDFPDYIFQHNKHLEVVEQLFHKIYLPGKLYRKTGVFSHDICSAQNKQLSLFTRENTSQNHSDKLQNTLYDITQKYGDEIIHFGCKI